MGKKDKKEEPPKEPPAKEANEKKEDEEEDTPCIKQLKEIDDKYCKIEVELEREISKLRKKYDERQAPLIEERRQVLLDAASCSEQDKSNATPGCPGFWVKALSNSELDQCLEENDYSVLEYMHDVKKSHIDPEDPDKGNKVEFHFKENPYFTNEVLWWEAHLDVEGYKPYKEPECIEQRSCTIDWKAGKNVTVEKKVKEAPGKRKGKKSGGKAKEEPCRSFFRFFQNVKKGENLPDGLEVMYEEELEEMDTEELVEEHLNETIAPMTDFIASQFIPYAIRWYTGEAAEDDDDMDFDEDSEEEDDDDDDEDSEDDEESDEPQPKKGGKKKPAGKKGGEGAGGDGGKKTEECKQQ